MINEDFRNKVAEMAKAGVPEEKIGEYIRNVKEARSVMAPKMDTDYGRIGAQMIGGAAGALAGAASPVPGGAFIGEGMGDAMAGQAWDRGREIFAKLTGAPPPLSAYNTPAGNATDAATDAVMAATMAKYIPVAGNKLKNVGKSIFAPLKKARAERLVGEVSPEVLSHMDDIEKMGGVPHAGLVIDNPATQKTIGAQRGNIATAGLWGETDKANYDAFTNYYRSTVDKIGTPLTPSEMGGQIWQHAKMAKDGLAAEHKELFETVIKELGDDTTIPMPETQKYFQQLKESAKNPALGIAIPPQLMQWSGLFEEQMKVSGGGVPVPVARTVKSRIGDVAYSGNSDISKKQLKDLEGAMRRDIEAAARAKGGRAAESLQKANLAYQLFKGDKDKGIIGYEQILDQIIKNPEGGNIYKSLMPKDGGKSETLERIFMHMPPNVKNNLRATALHQIGLATAGQQGAEGSTVSFNTLLTNLKSMSPETRKLLWNNKEFKEVESRLRRIERVSDLIKSLEKHGNLSGTAHTTAINEFLKPVRDGIMYMGGYGLLHEGLGGALKGAVVGGAIGGASKVAEMSAQRKTAKLLMDPHFVKWLAGAAEDGLKKSDKNFIPMQMTKLGILASTQPHLREGIKDYVQMLGYPMRIENEVKTNEKPKTFFDDHKKID